MNVPQNEKYCYLITFPGLFKICGAVEGLIMVAKIQEGYPTSGLQLLHFNWIIKKFWKTHRLLQRCRCDRKDVVSEKSVICMSKKVTHLHNILELKDKIKPSLPSGSSQDFVAVCYLSASWSCPWGWAPRRCQAVWPKSSVEPSQNRLNE